MTSKTAIIPPDGPKPIGPYSPAIKYGNLLFLSGVIGLNPSTGQMMQESIESEIHQIMENIRQLLHHAGLNWESLLKVTIYLTNMQYFETVNKIYGSFVREPYPARETVQVSALPRGARIEISAIASYA